MGQLVRGRRVCVCGVSGRCGGWMVCASGYKRPSIVLLVGVCSSSSCSRKKPFVRLAYVRQKNTTEPCVSFFFYLRSCERESERQQHAPHSSAASYPAQPRHPVLFSAANFLESGSIRRHPLSSSSPHDDGQRREPPTATNARAEGEGRTTTAPPSQRA